MDSKVVLAAWKAVDAVGQRLNVLHGEAVQGVDSTDTLTALETESEAAGIALNALRPAPAPAPVVADPVVQPTHPPVSEVVPTISPAPAV